MALRSLTQRAIDQLSFIQVIHRDAIAEVRLARTKLMDFILLNWITSQIEIINTFLLGSPRYINSKQPWSLLRTRRRQFFLRKRKLHDLAKINVIDLTS
jgi:hypothetical protein